MDLIKQIGWILLMIGVGIGFIVWQFIEWREKSGFTIYWIGIIPLPIALVGIICLIAGIWEFGKMFHLF